MSMGEVEDLLYRGNTTAYTKNHNPLISSWVY